MPGPEANTEYHCVAFFDVVRLAEVVDDDLARAALIHPDRSLPSRPFQLAFMPRIERLVVEQLRRPLDGVNLGDLGGDHQPRRLE